MRTYRNKLSGKGSQFIKRTFDILVSGIFICLIFPFIYIIVGLLIKGTSKGPIIFKQKRNGLHGKEFWIYKFRSMRENEESDEQQATKEDARKTKIGNFMRRTNIDEIPQFLNVFLGDMSIVGPRPHMVKHTEEYSKQVDNFMVRHWVKPGITGWSQVTGLRGEIKNTDQIAKRVEGDIWYIEHWSFALDIRIIFMTIVNIIKGEKEAY